MRSLSEIPNVSSVTALVRASLDVPIEGGRVIDGFRLDETLPTIAYLSARGAKVVLMGHVGRDPTNSMQPIYEYLKKKVPLLFTDDIVGPRAREAVQRLKNGEVLLLENLRRDAREVANDAGFAQQLASLGNVYVDDAFTNAHRAHASIVGVPKLIPSFAGIRFMEEVQGLTPALSPESPSLAVLGGAKLETKLPILHALLQKYDFVFVGGALVNDFYAAKGYEVGKSLVSGTDTTEGLLSNSKILLPEIITVSAPGGREDKPASEVLPGETISDIPPIALEKLKPLVAKARMVLWNGPMGHFEGNFTEGTDALAELIANASAKTIVGGGDTLASIQSLGLMKKFTFVSTAGGAMLDFLANGTLPGIEALER
ncbi:MAG: phosphoglycerate kinase [Patescibacteria group bacterium]|nr:phosphoglycerate kinase [Patescibacteria group bacterium]